MENKFLLVYGNLFLNIKFLIIYILIKINDKKCKIIDTLKMMVGHRVIIFEFTNKHDNDKVLKDNNFENKFKFHKYLYICLTVNMLQYCNFYKFNIF